MADTTVVADNSAFGGPNAAQAANANAVTGGAPSTTDFMTQLQGQLLNQSGMISSSNTKLEDQINSAISSQQAAGTATDKGINASYAGQEQAAQQAGQNKMTAAVESQRGFAQNTAALQQLTDATNKQVNDLEEQKQSALATGDAATASKISDLQMQGIQFQQAAQQQVFTNLLSMGDYAQKQQSNQLAQQSQDFAQSQAVSQVALKYGLTVQPGDTLSSITTRAMPYASQEEQLQLKQIQAQINTSDAQAKEALANAKAGQPLSETDIAGISQAILLNPQNADAYTANIKDSGTLAKIGSAVTAGQTQGIVQGYVQSGATQSSALSDLQSQLQNKKISYPEYTLYSAAVQKSLPASGAAAPVTLYGLDQSAAGGLTHVANWLTTFITGLPVKQ